MRKHARPSSPVSPSSSIPAKVLLSTLVVALAPLAGCDLAEDPVCSLLSENAPLERRAGFRALSGNGISANSISLNKLSANKLWANKLSANQLSENKLSANLLSENKLSANLLSENGLAEFYEAGPELDELAQTADGQELIHYVVGCALAPSQTVYVSTPDGTRAFDGRLGFVPQWAERSLTPDEERALTSCLLGHVNAFGVSVPISVRAPGLVGASEVEQDAFPIHEGAFFGSLVDQRHYACHADDPRRAQDESADRTWRACTDDDGACEMVVVGACADVCASYDEVDGYSDCTAEGLRFRDVANVYLRSDDVQAACAG